jgi:predicted RNA-binding protein YlqC (UPF0109 family)
MRIDNANGDPGEEPLIDPVPADGYDDVYEDEEGEGEAGDEVDEGEAEHEEDEILYAPANDAAEHLRGLVAYLATNLVDDPDSVEVEARQRSGSVFISLRVPEEELGKVIGRGGRIARAMRTALMIAGSRNNVRASLDIED